MELPEEVADLPGGIRYISDTRRFNNAMASIFRGKQTKEEELADIENAKAGDFKARDRLVAANSSVIVFVVYRVIRNGVMFLSSGTIEVWDLLMEGQFGFHDAIARYNDKGPRLATTPLSE